tara:strand:+ start:1311 stop:2864 length:1554 start_codon:yes stop_codon:yes gene_type:complete
MERLQNTDIPLSSLMGVRQSIRFDDNSTNVKLQSKKRLEELNDMMLERQQTVHRARMIREDINNNIIRKLRKVLSRKFKLTREEYIVLIDKFNLKNANLSRNTISDMITTLNIQKKYDDDNKFKKEGGNVNNSISNRMPPKKINNITMNSDTDEMFTETNKEKTFDDRLQEMINSRIPPNQKKQNSNNLNNDSDEKLNLTKQLDENKKKTAQFNPNNKVSGQNSFNNYDISKPVNNMGEEIYFPPANREEGVDPDKPLPERNMPKLQEYNNTSIDLSQNRPLMNSYYSSDNSNNNSNNKIPDRPHVVINDLPNYNSNHIINDTSRENNIVIPPTKTNDIEESLKKLIDKINIPVEKKVENKEYEFNIMANIIQSNGKTNTVNSEFKFEVNYNGKTSISNIKRVELVSCFINENFYRKNDFKNYPYFLIKIKEFDDVLYLNGSSMGGFCQIMWEKKGSYYNYINTDKLFGVYTPSKDMEFDKLTVEVYDHNGNILKELKSTEQDQFNLVLKIITDKVL